jgi:hypothetical protein
VVSFYSTVRVANGLDPAIPGWACQRFLALSKDRAWLVAATPAFLSPKYFNLSIATPTSLSTNHTLDKASHTTNIRHNYQCQNIANLQAAVNGMTAEGNNIAQSAQAYHGHQQALNTELSRSANYIAAQITQQLTAIQASIVQSRDISSAQ